VQASPARESQAEKGDGPTLAAMLGVSTLAGALPPAVAAMPALLAWLGASLPASGAWQWLAGAVLLIGIPASAWTSYRFTATRDGVERDDIVLTLLWTATTYLFFAAAAIAITVGVAFNGLAS
jgi:hypothetical protein